MANQVFGDGCHRDTKSEDAVVWIPKEFLLANVRDMDEELAQSTPAKSILLEWASRPQNQPPQAWWDDPIDPFSPDVD